MVDFKERFVSKEIAEKHNSYLESRGDLYNAQNPFSKILRGEIPAKIVAETPYAVIIQNQLQRTNIYNLALPIYPAKDLFDFTNNANTEDVIGYAHAIQATIQEIYQSKPSLKNHLNASSSRIVFNIGPYSQNTVPHLHAHIMADENLVDFNHLTLSQETASQLDLWSKEQPNPTIATYEDKMHSSIETAKQIEHTPNTTIKILNNGQKLGWKDCSSLHTLSLKSVTDLIRFFSAISSLATSRDEWGGRAVIDVNNNNTITAHASGNVLLRKLPLTPLTKEQLKAEIQNIRQ